MESEKEKCKRCDNEPPNDVIYRCARCFKLYCSRCEGTDEGKNCPNCGMFARMVLSQKPKKKVEYTTSSQATL